MGDMLGEGWGWGCILIRWVVLAILHNIDPTCEEPLVGVELGHVPVAIVLEAIAQNIRRLPDLITGKKDSRIGCNDHRGAIPNAIFHRMIAQQRSTPKRTDQYLSSTSLPLPRASPCEQTQIDTRDPLTVILRKEDGLTSSVNAAPSAPQLSTHPIPHQPPAHPLLPLSLLPTPLVAFADTP